MAKKASCQVPVSEVLSKVWRVKRTRKKCWEGEAAEITAERNSNQTRGWNWMVKRTDTWLMGREGLETNSLHQPITGLLLSGPFCNKVHTLRPLGLLGRLHFIFCSYLRSRFHLAFFFTRKLQLSSFLNTRLYFRFVFSDPRNRKNTCWNPPRGGTPIWKWRGCSSEN